jgi:putative ABC transport system permease protein
MENVALSSNRPLSGLSGVQVTIAGRPGPISDLGNVGTEQISSNFLPVMGIPLLRGRQFGAQDHGKSQSVAIINSRFAGEYFPHDDPIGKQFKLGLPDSPNPWLTIIGVTGDVERGDFFREMGYQYVPIVYLPIAQSSRDSINLIFRTNHRDAGLAASLQAVVKGLDARVPVHDVITVGSVVSANFSQPRFRTFLLGVFAGLALLLAAIGLYGVLTQTVIQMKRDIGVRMALGAAKQDILRMVIGQGMTLAGAGMAAGLVASAYFTKFLATMLYGVKPFNPLTFAATAGVLMSVALVAIYLPARRAINVDPIVVLKEE